MSNNDKIKQLRDLLQRIKQWDHMDVAGDGPYWKKEIDNVLAATEQANHWHKLLCWLGKHYAPCWHIMDTDTGWTQTGTCMRCKTVIKKSGWW